MRYRFIYGDKGRYKFADRVSTRLAEHGKVGRKMRATADVAKLRLWQKRKLRRMKNLVSEDDLEGTAM